MSETYWVRWRMYGPADAWNGDKFCDDLNEALELVTERAAQFDLVILEIRKD